MAGWQAGRDNLVHRVSFGQLRGEGIGMWNGTVWYPVFPSQLWGQGIRTWDGSGNRDVGGDRLVPSAPLGQLREKGIGLWDTRWDSLVLKVSPGQLGGYGT